MGADGATRLKKRTSRRKVARLLILGFFISLAIFAVYWLQPKIIKRLDSTVYDLLLRSTAAPLKEREPSLVIVDIDETSLAIHGQWPWSRYVIANMLQQLTDYGVKAIGMDIILSEEDRTSPDILLRRFKEDLDLDVTLKGIPKNLSNYDAYLAETMKNTPTTLAFFAFFNDELPENLPEILPKAPAILERELIKNSPSPKANLRRAGSATMPIRTLSDVSSVGFTNAATSEDGIIRSVPLVAKVGEKIYPSLALSTLMIASGVKNIILQSDYSGLSSIRVGKYEIPVNERGEFAIPYRGGKYAYPYYSADELLSGKAGAAEFADKIVFMGSSAVGLQDIRATPFDQTYPGVEVHLSLLDAVITGRSINVPSYTPALQLFVIFITGLVCALAFGLAKPIVYFPVGIVLSGSVAVGSWWGFNNGIFISPSYALFTVVAQASILVCLRFWQEESHKRFIKGVFSRYVAPEVVNSISQRDDDFLSGQKRELTILFSDLRGFTTMSETLDPQQVVNLLDEYFTPMTAIVRDTGGTVDKFIGDALMAFWNAPLDVPDHAMKAVSASLRMMEALKNLNPVLEEKYGITLKIGVGLHTGGVYVGNMGSKDVVNYTVIGDNVNLASRLEGLSKTYGQSILVSEDTAKSCGDGVWKFIHLDSLRVKGKNQAVNVYTPITKERYDENREELELFAEARDTYFKGGFEDAAGIFTRLQKINPDSQLYLTYLERISGLLIELPDEWDGSWTFHTK